MRVRPRTRAARQRPKSPLVVNVKDKGAKGDGKTDDTASIQAAIDEVAGTGGTVLVPEGTYMVEVAPRPRLSLKSDMTLKLAENATLKAIPTDDEKSAVLTIAGVSNVAVIGGTLEGERDEHKGKKDKRGGWGMGLYIRDGAEHILIAGVTARKMWADGFYVSGASDVKFCEVTADNNRRQGLSIIEADGLVVTNSVFKNTAGTRPGAGIDFEPDERDQAITNVKIENSKFIDNAGPGILIAGKKGTVAKIELTRNMFKGNRPILAEDAPEVLASSICGNRQLDARGDAVSRPQCLCRPGRGHGASKRLRGRRGHALRGHPGKAQAIQIVALLGAWRRDGSSAQLSRGPRHPFAGEWGGISIRLL